MPALFKGAKTRITRIGNDQVEVLADPRRVPLLDGRTTATATESVRNGHLSAAPSGTLTHLQLSYKMLYMRKATNISIRELQQNLKGVLARVERGEIIEVTRHRRPVARLEPTRPSGTVPLWPDLDARARAVFGDRLVMPSPSDIVIEDRGDR